MKSFYLSIPNQPNIRTNTSVNNLETISFSLLLFLAIPLVIVSFFKYHQRDHTKKMNDQRQLLEKIWTSKSGKPRI